MERYSNKHCIPDEKELEVFSNGCGITNKGRFTKEALVSFVQEVFTWLMI